MGSAVFAVLPVAAAGVTTAVTANPAAAIARNHPCRAMSPPSLELLGPGSTLQPDMDRSQDLCPHPGTNTSTTASAGNRFHLTRRNTVVPVAPISWAAA